MNGTAFDGRNMDRSKTEEGAPERIRRARESLGLSEKQVAEALQLPIAWYCDVEAYPWEVFSTVSLSRLQLLGRVLRLEPREILVGDPDGSPTGTIAFKELSAAVARKMAERSLDVQAASERVGWELSEVLGDPEKFWDFNIEGLRDVCGFAEIDWLAVVAGLPQ